LQRCRHEGNYETAMHPSDTDTHFCILPAARRRYGPGAATPAWHNLLHADLLVLGSTAWPAGQSVRMSKPEWLDSGH
jgi:hypothetical protein